jgi:hypothetical protein
LIAQVGVLGLQRPQVFDRHLKPRAEVFHLLRRVRELVRLFKPARKIIALVPELFNLGGVVELQRRPISNLLLKLRHALAV